MGQGSDWDRVLDGWPFAYAWKRNGSAWGLQFAPEHGGMELKFVRFPVLDNTHWRAITFWTLLRDDGTLWFWDGGLLGTLGLSGNSQSGLTLIQASVETNWADVAFGSGGIMARKTDGSLWKWAWPSHKGKYDLENSVFNQLRENFSHPPVCCSIHRDWVALNNVGGDTVSLAADGSLWSWPEIGPVAIGYRDAQNFFLISSRKPARIENLFEVGK
jgi:hypothetical protein